ncbi:threonine synthase [Terribacillus sp. 179-K 1B1 HS]|uniref:threonine synthase n=1 Tax=Terribacillus sp. 179-K 1B1 HS TaxID=3142388 RepID=UPI0039A131F7
MVWNGLLEAYREHLPISEETPAVNLGEGNTPLVKLEKISAAYGIDAYAKIEGANPTGSFKDRGMVMAIAKAKEAGAKAVICASTGNTSASAAAYAARAGMRCFVVIPEGKIAQGKLAQAVMYGAEIFSIEGNFDDALRVVRNLSETEPVALVNSVNPYRLEGQKTAAFELCEQLGQAPDYLFIPVGNAGNISAYWKGFKEYEQEKGFNLPVLKGYQASGAAPIVHDRVFENPETVGTAIRIGNPASWQKATAARDESGGTIDEVTDEQIIAAYQKIARKEGVFAEPGSCASFAGLLKALEQGEVAKGSKVVCVLTGNGLKDPNTAIEYSTIKPVVLPNDETVIADAIKERM